MRRTHSGFTLVEIAIVLVIIGLLLGGVLKGQELINSAKVKNLAQDFRQVPLLIYGYQDKFKRLPGDDPAADASRFANFKRATKSGQTPGNGIIEGTWDSTDVTSENVLFWQHVRGIGLSVGSTDFSGAAQASLPSNAEGGLVGIQMIPPMVGLSGSYYVCSAGIGSKLAQQLDTTLDDGSPDKGTLRAQIVWDQTKGGDAAYADGKSYTVCMAF